MAYPVGEAKREPLRVDFDRRLELEFHGGRTTLDAGLLAYRKLDDALGPTEPGGMVLSETRHGKNIRHLLVGLLRQSEFGRLAGYEDVNDAERLSQDPVMRTIVDRKGLDRIAASTSRMGRFETAWLATEENVDALGDLSGLWIDWVHARKPPKVIVLVGSVFFGGGPGVGWTVYAPPSTYGHPGPAVDMAILYLFLLFTMMVMDGFAARGAGAAGAGT